MRRVRKKTEIGRQKKTNEKDEGYEAKVDKGILIEMMTKRGE